MNQKDSKIAKAVKQVILEFDASASVLLFGSRARGTARTDSDYDFLVLLNIPFDFRLKNKILDELYQIELDFDCVLGVLVNSTNQWQSLENTPLFAEIAQEGIVL